MFTKAGFRGVGQEGERLVSRLLGGFIIGLVVIARSRIGHVGLLMHRCCDRCIHEGWV